MGGAIGRGAVLSFFVLLLAGGPAFAQTSDEAVWDEETGPASEPPPRPSMVDAAEQTPDYPAVQETQLIPTDHGVQASPTDWVGDLDVDPDPFPSLIRKHIAQHRDFVQPFLDPAVYPEISAKILTFGGLDRPTHSASVDQLAYVSLYFFDLYAPLLTMQDNVFFSPNRVRMDLKLPIIFGHQVITFFAGANVPTNAAWTEGSGVNTMLGYAVGSRWLSLQLRAGYGYDQLIGDYQSPLAPSMLADAALSLALGRHAALLIEGDGRKLIGQPGETLRAWPGLRFFPLDEATFSVGVGAMWWADAFNAAGQYLGQFRTRTVGGFLDVGYVFL